ncbi:MAG TPA: N-acetylmuramoyl-L-alanine amidase, partial [Candidatus Udaeobacter sp.]|nr:N-acetylmuramoyl-L-alanine amidase [Candidatus Udaeobacter sp.]
DLGAADSSGLPGKRIAIDPGHGGFFKGAIGVHGLTEAEVNLGVALDLKRLLTARGAAVLLTRETDRDFVSPSDSSLHADLAERMRLANEFHPDLFISIHHNADARGSHDVNETQTYYKLADPGPSLDAASDVHRSLVRNVGIEKHRVVPGNYFVLRSSDAPALLTESSYLTNPDVEAKLALAEKRELEADALYLGIARYFARHLPVIEEFRAWAPGQGGDSALTTHTPLLSARVRGAFDAWSMTVDGQPVLPEVDEGAIQWRPRAPLRSGTHEATLAVRLAGEGSARSREIRFRITGEPARIETDFPGQNAFQPGQPLGLRVRVFDRYGLPLDDSLRVTVRATGAGRVMPAETTITIRDGEAWAYLRPIESRATRRTHRAAPTLAVRAALGGAHPIDATARIESGERTRSATLTGFAMRMPEAVPLLSAPGTTGPEASLDWINRDGFVHLSPDADGHVRIPLLRGYRAWPEGSSEPHVASGGDSLPPVPTPGPAWPPRFVAIAGGALHARRIVIDPEGGGDDAAGEGPGGTRAATLNLEVARALAGFLSAAGAEVKLTRDGDVALSDVARVQISEAFHPDRFLRIGHAADAPAIGFYFSSAPGKAWASRTQSAFASIGLPPPPAAEDAEYVVQQASCPALRVSPARIDAGEARLLSPGALRAEAYALFLALAHEWAPAAAWPADSLEARDGAGHAIAGLPIRLGGALVLETDATGRVRFARTEPGAVEIEAWTPAEPGLEPQRVRRLLLESERGVVLTIGSTGR